MKTDISYKELQSTYEYLACTVQDIYRSACKNNLKSSFEYKELNDIATETDRFMEAEIVKAIRRLFPDHRFIGEEYGQSESNSEYEWLIDPIDGTVNYAAGIPMFGTSIALRKNKETILGIIFDWPNNKIYHAIKGHGSFDGDQILSVSKRTDLRESIVTICLTSSYDEMLTDKVLGIIKKLQPHVRGVRIIVCTVYELMWLAHGYTECMINIKPSIGVGSCAGKLIIQEAGGKVTNTNGKKRADIDDLLITNSAVHDQILEILEQCRRDFANS